MSKYTPSTLQPELPFVKLCECGCGQPAPISKHDHKRSGHTKGQPVRFIKGHNMHFSAQKLFWDHVDKRRDDECWHWTGRLNGAGYGETRWKHKTARAHRVSYELHYGPILDGLLVCHKCDANYPPGDIAYRRCVNPNHLFLGTDADNMTDKVEKGRQNKGETHGMAKLTEKQVVEIRELRASKHISYAKLGVKYGVSGSAIRDIIVGENWGWLE